MVVEENWMAELELPQSLADAPRPSAARELLLSSISTGSLRRKGTLSAANPELDLQRPLEESHTGSARAGTSAPLGQRTHTVEGRRPRVSARGGAARTVRWAAVDLVRAAGRLRGRAAAPSAGGGGAASLAVLARRAAAAVDRESLGAGSYSRGEEENDWRGAHSAARGAVRRRRGADRGGLGRLRVSGHTFHHARARGTKECR